MDDPLSQDFQTLQVTIAKSSRERRENLENAD